MAFEYRTVSESIELANEVAQRHYPLLLKPWNGWRQGWTAGQIEDLRERAAPFCLDDELVELLAAEGPAPWDMHPEKFEGLSRLASIQLDEAEMLLGGSGLGEAVVIYLRRECAAFSPVRTSSEFGSFLHFPSIRAAAHCWSEYVRVFSEHGVTEVDPGPDAGIVRFMFMNTDLSLGDPSVQGWPMAGCREELEEVARNVVAADFEREGLWDFKSLGLDQDSFPSEVTSGTPLQDRLSAAG